MPAGGLENQVLKRAGKTAGLSWDDEQELKEAICDAVLERMRRVVTGVGPSGAVVFGQAPSRALTSGFLLPRLSDSGDDESSDISICLHGVDCRLNALTPGKLAIVPRFNLYVRVLPTPEDVFDPRLVLRPKAELNAAANGRKRDAITALTRSDDYKKKTATEKRLARKEALAKFLRDLGVTASEHQIREAEDAEGEEGSDDAPAALDVLDADVRIPDAHSIAQEIPKKYRRLEPDLPALNLELPWSEGAWKRTLEAYTRDLNGAIRKTYLDWLASPDGQMWAWRSVRAPGSSFWTRAHWEAFLTEVRKTSPDPDDLIPGMSITIIADVRPDPLALDTLTTRFAIENCMAGANEAEDGIFQVNLQLSLPSSALRQMPMERVRRSYHFAGFLLVPAIGVNGGVLHREEEGRSTLTTTWCPRFVLPRMRAVEIPKLPVSFEELRSPTFDVKELDRLPAAMEKWVTKIEKNSSLCEPGEEGSQEDEERQVRRFKDDIDAWRREASRMQHGVAVLARSQAAYRDDQLCLEAAPYRAWLLTNETFEKATGNPGWRLFQLGFILTHIPTLASRLSAFEADFDYGFDEGSASLLYMSTGGGKSEAFFGVLVFALFLDRLRGKRRGVTAMLHYPLRLLTLQQARRLMRLLASAEMLRHRRSLAGAPFELGFWVGSGNTPNSTASGENLLQEFRDIPKAADDPFLTKEAKYLEERASYVSKNESWNKIPECPFCGSLTGLRIYPLELNRLGIACSNKGCDWNRAHDTPSTRKALPFILVDTDIYRRAPSVLLGTVDKLALLGNHPSTINRIAGMFGLARFIAGGTDTGLLLTPNTSDQLDRAVSEGRPIAPAFSGGEEVFHDPLPSLIVQDEMHLLEESLGTFGGLFETTLFAWFKELARLLGSRASTVPGLSSSYRMPHVIGATATAADADRQMQHLYQRKAVQFPHPGPRLYGSFYTQLEEFDTDGAAAKARGGRTKAREQEALAPWARVYASLLTNGKSHTSATIEILSAYAVGITRWSRDLCASNPERRKRATEEIIDSLSEGPLRQRHEAVLRRAVQANLFKALASLVDLHRIMLTYVTNKKGGDQLMSALDREVAREHELLGDDYKIARFDIELISGGIDIRAIQDVIKKAEKVRDPEVNDVEESLRAIVATSAISHGVDVSSFNAMTFAGVPSDIAEYIQASSRVGRTHVGFSLLIPTPQNRRDRFIIDNHETFHRFLERMIAPPAIERWADKAIRRTLPSLVQTYFTGVHFQQAFCAASDAAKKGVPFPDQALVLRNLLSGPKAASTKKALLAFLEEALGLQADYAGAPTAEHYRNLLRQAIDDIAAELETGRHGGDLRAFWAWPEGPFRGFGPMSSLRDVDQGGTIRGDASRRTVTGRPIKPSATRDAMDFITKRLIAGRKSRTESSELAPEGGG